MTPRSDRAPRSIICPTSYRRKQVHSALPLLKPSTYHTIGIKLFKLLFSEGALWDYGDSESRSSARVPNDKVVWYGDPGQLYHFAGKQRDHYSWHEYPLITEVRDQLEKEFNCSFNSLMCSHYKNGYSLCMSPSLWQISLRFNRWLLHALLCRRG